MGIFNIFIKKENKFLVLLNQMVGHAESASELLVEFMLTRQEDPRREHLNDQIKTHEVAADKVYDTIFDELNTTFITPFDREDIQALAAKLDDVLDFVYGVAKQTMMYNIEEIPESFVTMAQIVHQQCQALNESMSHLGKVAKSPEIVKKECQKIHNLETQADEVYATFVTDLFANCKDPIELIKLNKIIQYLENATDVTEDVADVIRTIIVKYN